MKPETYSNLEVVSRHGSADGLQIEQPGLLPVEKAPHMYGLEVDEPAPSKVKRICGLRQPTFWLSLVLTAIIIIGVGVGVGVGVHQATNKNTVVQPVSAPSSLSSNGTSTSPSPSSSASNSAATPTSTQKPTRDCPGSNGSSVTEAGGNKYQKFCSSALGGTYEEIFSDSVLTFNACISVCSDLNYNLNRTDISAMYSANGVHTDPPLAPGYCLCAQTGQIVVTDEPEYDLATLMNA